MPRASSLGAVHFATSCNGPAQQGINHAVALLHSFQFSDAVAGFNAVLEADPSCAIAYWGIALSDWSNPFAPGLKDKAQLQLGQQSAQAGQALRARTARERAYIAAVAKLYEDFAGHAAAHAIARTIAMRCGSSRPPIRATHEAQIFYALALAAAQDPKDKSYADDLRAGAILEKLFVQEPTHPGLAHYIIHAYDVPALAATGARGSAPLRAHRPRRPARAAHALAYLHPPGVLAGLDRQQPRSRSGRAATGPDRRGAACE